MRTTIDLADHLLLRAKQLAAAERTTLTAILVDPNDTSGLWQIK